MFKMKTTLDSTRLGSMKGKYILYNIFLVLFYIVIDIHSLIKRSDNSDI